MSTPNAEPAEPGPARRRFVEVDVFGSGRYRGNPLAVVIDAEGLTADQMQRFANWTNFSETTFLLPPTTAAADYRVRIFTPVEELPFAGHPTLGTGHVWLAAGGTPRSPGQIVQECGVGLVAVRTGDELAFAAPPLQRSGPVDDIELAAICDTLGVDPTEVVDSAWIDNGPGWVGLLLADSAAVLAVSPGPGDRKIGLVGFHPSSGPSVYEVRGFFPKDGATAEDPVTGSLNASVAQWLTSTGRVTAPYVASQGAALGRDGRVSISVDVEGQVWVGGQVHTCVEGWVDL